MTPAWVAVMRESGIVGWDRLMRGAVRKLSGAWDISDYATRALCLAVLARRVGLDPEGGVCWHKYNNREWYLGIPTWRHCFVHPNRSTSETIAYPKPPFTRVVGLDTDDPLLALALCLRATTPPAVGADPAPQKEPR